MPTFDGYKMTTAEADYREAQGLLFSRFFAAALPETVDLCRQADAAAADELMARLRAEAEEARAALDAYRGSGRPQAKGGRMVPGYAELVAASVAANLKLKGSAIARQLALGGVVFA